MTIALCWVIIALNCKSVTTTTNESFIKKSIQRIFQTRSLGALRAPISSLRPFGPPWLRPSGAQTVWPMKMCPWCMYPWCDACIHDACIHDTCIHDACIHDPWSWYMHVWCIYLWPFTLDPDACMYDAYICDPGYLNMLHVCVMHISMMYVPMTHVSMVHVSLMQVYMMWYSILDYAACVYDAAEIFWPTDQLTDKAILRVGCSMPIRMKHVSMMHACVMHVKNGDGRTNGRKAEF